MPSEAPVTPFSNQFAYLLLELKTSPTSNSPSDRECILNLRLAEVHVRETHAVSKMWRLGVCTGWVTNAAVELSGGQQVLKSHG